MTIGVTHVLNTPGHGGVPRVVRALVSRTDRKRYAPSVFFLKPGEGIDLFSGFDAPLEVAEEGLGKMGAIAALAGFLEAGDISVLHTHSFRPNLYGRLAGALLRPAGLRIVAHYHNDYADKWADPSAITLERRLGRITDARIAVSGAVAEHVKEWTGAEPANLSVIRNGLDLDRLACADRARGRRALGLEDGHVCIGLVGRICAQKGIDTFVEAALRLLPDQPQARFVVLGTEEDKALAARLRSRAADAPDQAIRLLGHREDIGDILAAFDILAAPSRWEGFGLSVVEGMAMGLPVIASDVGGIPEVTQGTARLIPPDDPGALAVEFGALIGDSSLRLCLGRSARRQAQSFDWSTTARLVDGLYDTLLARP
ncbi:MAG: glycosyltransferase [Albidovulum sp.]|uniref:glycosyltransferase n=1 Tax=Albidovulum sp. TaxID=1872424 RepID=UPI003C8199AA